MVWQVQRCRQARAHLPFVWPALAPPAPTLNFALKHTPTCSCAYICLADKMYSSIQGGQPTKLPQSFNANGPMARLQDLGLALCILLRSLPL